MTPENYTSLKLSKWLHENGCELVAGRVWSKWKLGTLDINKGEELYEGEYRIVSVPPFSDKDSEYPAYSYYDIMVKYAKEFFGGRSYDFFYITGHILGCLQRGKKQEAEDYIKEHCLFNPKNK